MNQTDTKFLTDILRNISGTEHIRPADIPDISLYMDQVTGFMNEHLNKIKRSEDDKVLTKTMINNYTKEKLLPHPDKKRYTRKHLILLIYIYYFKDFLSLTDIRTILSPIMDKFFPGNESPSIDDIYEETYGLCTDYVEDICDDIMSVWHTASDSFIDCSPDDRETLQIFSFICMLSFDIFIKKQVIEQMIDRLPNTDPEGS